MDTAESLDQARTALRTAVARNADMFRSLSDGSAPVKRSDWSIGEVGAHLLVGLRAFTDAANGDLQAFAPYLTSNGNYRDRMSGLTSGSLAMFPERSPAALADAFPGALDRFLDATASMAPGDTYHTPWYANHATHSVTSATSLLVGEQLMHGLDIARTVGRPWPISRSDAYVLMNVFERMLPYAVNPDRAAKVSATFEMHARGGPGFVIRVHNGTVETLPSTYSGSVDCHLSADPVALALVGYGRTSQWGPIATMKLTTWGRKPWLAFTFRGLFFNP